MDRLCELLCYELGVMRDAEKAGREMFDALVDQVQNNDLAQVLRMQGQDLEQSLGNITACVQALGGSPPGIASETVAGMRSRFELFTRLRPSPEVRDLFALSTATVFANFGIGSYRVLIGWATLAGEEECAQRLRTNLALLERYAGTLAQLGHELGARVPTA